MDVEEAVATTQSEDLGGAAVSQSDDKIISAEIPDSTPERRELRKIVLRTMVHMRHEMLQRQGRGARRRRSPARRRRPRAEECRAADRHRQPELCGVLKSAKKALKSAPPPQRLEARITRHCQRRDGAPAYSILHVARYIVSGGTAVYQGKLERNPPLSHPPGQEPRSRSRIRRREATHRRRGVRPLAS